MALLETFPVEPDRLRVAQHESGHAVLAHLLGVPVVQMSLPPDGALAGEIQYMPYRPDSDRALWPQQSENIACVALGGEVAEVLLHGSADPKGLVQDHATVAHVLSEHPQGRALWPVLRARAEQLLSTPEALAAVHTLAGALAEAGVLDAPSVELHVRHLPRSRWALGR